MTLKGLRSWLRRYLRRNALNQSELAQRLRVSRTIVSDVMRGKRELSRELVGKLGLAIVWAPRPPRPPRRYVPRTEARQATAQPKGG